MDYVPHRINLLFKGNFNGVYEINNKYRVQMSINNKVKCLGTYYTQEYAFKIYKQAKENEIKRIADEYKDKIPSKLYEVLYDYEVEINY